MAQPPCQDAGLGHRLIGFGLQPQRSLIASCAQLQHLQQGAGQVISSSTRAAGTQPGPQPQIALYIVRPAPQPCIARLADTAVQDRPQPGRAATAHYSSKGRFTVCWSPCLQHVRGCTHMAR